MIGSKVLPSLDASSRGVTRKKQHRQLALRAARMVRLYSPK